MGNKFKPWQSSERRPKKFRKLTSLGEGGYDNYGGGGRSHRERRRNDRQNWKRQSWDQEPA